MCHRLIVTALSLLLGAGLIDGLDVFLSGNPHFAPGREVIVHLFEWKWNDIADECERFFGPKGFAGVQTSPVTENLIVPSRPWWERYHPISYQWITRSGNEQEFKDMVRRCNQVGVRIFVDLVINHMSGSEVNNSGTGGSIAFPAHRYYPGVPYTSNDFNPHCRVENSSDVYQVRNCYHIGNDLDQSNEHVRRRIVTLMNKLVAAGVAGFRIDTAMFMWPEDLKAIYSRVRSLEPDHGFPNNARPYIYQAVDYCPKQPHLKYEYNSFGVVTEVLYSIVVAIAMRGAIPLKNLQKFRTLYPLLPSNNAIIFVDNHESQRYGVRTLLSHKSSKLYKMAIAFMLAHPYGNPRIMSSYAFVNVDQGPPADENGNIISPTIKDDGGCDGGWICEHRWRQISNMVAFRNIVSGTTINDWWISDYNQIAFSRGDKGFIAINGNDTDLVATIQTRLPRGFYCDVISGNFIDGKCSGKIVSVDESGKAEVEMSVEDEDRVIAIHRNAKLRD